MKLFCVERFSNELFHVLWKYKVCLSFLYNYKSLALHQIERLQIFARVSKVIFKHLCQTPKKFPGLNK
jgi:hypothetical protein